MNNTFTLNPNPQTEAFLTEKRKDPVTGETFKEGDEIVFCASCKSAFLKGSWEYMGGEHCGQSETLEIFPEVSKRTKKLKLFRTGGQLLFKLQHSTHEKSLYGFITILSMISLGSFVIGLSEDFLSESAITLLGAALGSGSLSGLLFYNSEKLIKQAVFLNDGVRIRKKLYSWQDISECRLTYHAFYNDDGFLGSELVDIRIKVSFFFHNDKREVKSVELGGFKNAQFRRRFMMQFFEVTDKVRLVIDENSFPEGDIYFIRNAAEQFEHTIFTESLYY